VVVRPFCLINMMMMMTTFSNTAHTFRYTKLKYTNNKHTNTNYYADACPAMIMSVPKAAK